MVGQPRRRAHAASARGAGRHQGLHGQHQRNRHPGRAKLPGGLRQGQQGTPQAGAPAGDGAGRADGVPGPRPGLGLAPRGHLVVGPAPRRGLRQGGRAARVAQAVARRAPVLGRRADVRAADAVRVQHHVAAVHQGLRVGAHGRADAQRAAHRLQPHGVAAAPGSPDQPQRHGLGGGAVGGAHQHPRRRLRALHRGGGSCHLAQPEARRRGRLHRLQAAGLGVGGLRDWRPAGLVPSRVPQ